MILQYLVVIIIVLRLYLISCIIVILLTHVKMLPNDDNPGVSGQNQTVSDPHIDHYRIPKIPKFFRANPETWFLRVEASLRSAHITVDNTKADFVIAELDDEIVESLNDLITKIPQPEDLYLQIKKRIISTFASSAEENLRKLLKGQIATTGKPSLILNRLRGLSNGKCSDEILRTIFTEHLPTTTRAILAASEIGDLNKFAEMAYKIAENTPSVENAAIATVETPVASNSEFSKIRDDIKALVNRLEKVERKQNTRYTRSQSKHKPKGKPAPAKSKEKICYAHEKYPDNPLSCNPSCARYSTWKQGK